MYMYTCDVFDLVKGCTALNSKGDMVVSLIGEIPLFPSPQSLSFFSLPLVQQVRYSIGS